MSAEAPSTIANVGIVAVATTSSTIQAGIVKSAIIDNFLAFVASKACMAGAFEAVDQVSANTAILTWVRATFVNIKVAIRSTETYGKKNNSSGRRSSRSWRLFLQLLHPVDDGRQKHVVGKEQENSLAAATLQLRR